MHKYLYTLGKNSGHVFADTMVIAQMKAAHELQIAPHAYEIIKVRLVEKNAGMVAQ